MGKDGADFDLAGAGALAGALAFAAPQRFAPHGYPGAITADTEDFTGGGIVDRGLGATPLGHPGAKPFNHALNLPPIDLQAQVGQQVLAGRLKAAGQSPGPAHALSGR